MHSRLAEIVQEKQREVEKMKKRGHDFQRDFHDFPVRDFREAISFPDRVNLIAEIKFASPSAGQIREKTDPLSIARIYEEAGAAAISLLTDRRFFGGALDQLPRVRRKIHLPILRKDFILDPIQIEESFHYGADALLLIARLLSEPQMREFIQLTRELEMTPLVEVHDREDLEKAVHSGADVLGINNRDLDTFEVHFQTTLELMPLVPESCVVVSESGIMHGEDIRRLEEHGVRAVLVGTALMESEDIMLRTRELVLAGRKDGQGKNMRHYE